jgi:hypothetical protein
MRKLGLKYKKQQRAICLWRDLQKLNAKLKKNKNKKNPKMPARLTKKIPRILLVSIVLEHVKSFGFSAQAARCGHKKNALTAYDTTEIL